MTKEASRKPELITLKKTELRPKKIKQTDASTVARLKRQKEIQNFLDDMISKIVSTFEQTEQSEVQATNTKYLIKELNKPSEILKRVNNIDIVKYLNENRSVNFQTHEETILDDSLANVEKVEDCVQYVMENIIKNVESACRKSGQSFSKLNISANKTELGFIDTDGKGFGEEIVKEMKLLQDVEQLVKNLIKGVQESLENNSFQANVLYDSLLQPSLSNNSLQQPSVVTAFLQRPDVPTDCLQQPIVSDDHLQNPIVPNDRLKQPIVPNDRLKQPIVPNDHLQLANVSNDCLQQANVSNDCFQQPIVSNDCFQQPIVSNDCFQQPIVSTDCFQQPIVSTDCLQQPIVSTDCLQQLNVSIDSVEPKTIAEDSLIQPDLYISKGISNCKQQEITSTGYLKQDSMSIEYFHSNMPVGSVQHASTSIGSLQKASISADSLHQPSSQADSFQEASPALNLLQHVNTPAHSMADIIFKDAYLKETVETASQILEQESNISSKSKRAATLIKSIFVGSLQLHESGLSVLQEIQIMIDMVDGMADLNEYLQMDLQNIFLERREINRMSGYVHEHLAVIGFCRSEKFIMNEAIDVVKSGLDILNDIRFVKSQLWKLFRDFFLIQRNFLNHSLKFASIPYEMLIDDSRCTWFITLAKISVIRLCGSIFGIEALDDIHETVLAGYKNILRFIEVFDELVVSVDHKHDANVDDGSTRNSSD